MERFLERITYSKYKDDFIVKGGILVTSTIGISMRSTMDIDTTIRNFDLTKEETTRIVNEIKDISLTEFEVYSKLFEMDGYKFENGVWSDGTHNVTLTYGNNTMYINLTMIFN